IITKSTKRSTLDFANAYLFDPLAITIKRWDVDPQGYYLGGTGLFLTARDMAKIGFLYLNGGCYAGRNIICEKWINDAWSDHIPDTSIDYGYLWWIMESGGHKIAYAFGYGGQMIYVIKDLQLVVVLTADPNVNAQTAQNTRILEDDILISNIIPAVH
ncbi:serine hydrolase, partial [bacterium]|nr:serine hydrolase [bacterium]